MQKIMSHKGLTLIETVIALVLVAVMAAAFAGAIIAGLKSETTTKNLDYAVEFSAAVFDYLGESTDSKNNFSEYVLKNINVEDSYLDSLEDFVSAADSNFLQAEIYNYYLNENNFKYNPDNSTIEIEKINDDLDLYRIELNISWDDDGKRGIYTVASAFGDQNE